MASIFNQELPFWKKVNNLTDIIILNVLFIVCCIPVVTAGAAYSALYYSLVKSIKKNRGYAVKNFFHSFVQNLKQGIPSTIIFGLIFYFAIRTAYDNWGAALVSENVRFIFWTAVFVILFLGCVLTYFYAVLSRFYFSFSNLFMFTFVITFKHFLTTIILLALLIVFATICWLCIPVFLIIGIAGYTYVSSFFIEKIFMKYMTKFEKVQPTASDTELTSIDETEASEAEETDSETADKDQWYYE